MLLVILGAGASYDSVPALRPQRVVLGPDSARPPLASELFADRERFATILEGFPACHPIVPILRHQSPDGLTVEQILEDLQNQAPKHPARTKQLAAIRFYLQAMIAKCQSAWEESAKGITNYKVLLDQIERGRPGYSRVCLVTFNYDTMLENALYVVGHQIRSIDDDIASDRYKVIKVHGSVDWAHAVDTCRHRIRR